MKDRSHSDAEHSMKDYVLEEAHYNGTIVTDHALDPDGSFRVDYHMHPYYELNFILSCGKVNVFNHDDHFETNEPCVIIHRPMTIHGLRAEQGVAYERILLDIDTAIPKQLGSPYFPMEQLCRAGMSAIYLRGALKAECIDLLEKISDPLASLPRKTLLCALLVERLTKEVQAEKNLLRQEHKRASYINDVLGLLYAQFQTDLHTEQIAEQFFVSRAKLNRDFEQATGTSIKQYILRLRVSHAKFLLRKGVTCSEVAKKCGFGNAQYFTRAFSKIE